MRNPRLVCMPRPTAAPISSLKYGMCHWSGASTTPSRDMKKFDTILPIGIASSIDYEQLVDLADGGGQPGLEAHGDHLLHRLERREGPDQLHVGAAVGPLGERDPDYRRGQLDLRLVDEG